MSPLMTQLFERVRKSAMPIKVDSPLEIEAATELDRMGLVVTKIPKASKSKANYGSIYHAMVFKKSI